MLACQCVCVSACQRGSVPACGVQFENDGSGGTVKPAVSRATRLGEHGGSGGTVTPAGSRATRLGEHDGSGGTLKPAGGACDAIRRLDELPPSVQESLKKSSCIVEAMLPGRFVTRLGG